MRVQAKSLRLVPRSENLHGIGRHSGRRRDLRQEPPVRATEPKLAVWLSIELVRAPISTTRPSGSCRITTRLASHARRWDVPAGTRVPPSRTDWPG